ncbi:MAG: tRNA methyl transferase PRC-barrel domain-containing protein, partial [Patescibacteria group bacterium]
EEEERRDAMRVAAFLDIPFLTFDLEEVYKKQVADYMISEYKAGRTPNPDVMCNKEVKFGAFYKKAIEMGADYVATGHYAQIFYSPCQGGVPEGRGGLKKTNPPKPSLVREGSNLVKAKDPSKDQVYFLWALNKKLLSKILFPIGKLDKTEVRKLAKKFKLPVAEKKDSQGICFLGAVDLKDFLKHYIKEKRGKVMLAHQSLGDGGNEKEEVIGFHNGAVFYTLGERHGFTITKKKSDSKPFYVVKKDVKKNILYVSQNRNLKPSLIKEGAGGGNSKNHHLALRKAQGTPPQQGGEKIILKNLNWISNMPKIHPARGGASKKLTAQIRYHGEFLNCKIKKISKLKVEVLFEKQILVASGQSCVFYDKNICLGGGVIV